MKKGLLALVAIIILAALAGGAYALLHKSPKTNTSTTTQTSSKVPAINNAIVVTKTSSSLGQYLAEPNGRALYTYNPDSSGVSKCSGSCIITWPAYQDKGSTTNLPAGFSTIQRADNGQIQYTYNGLPLYTFVGDIGSHVTGNNVSNFKIAKPAAASSSTTTSTQSTTTSPSSDSSSANW